MRPTPRLVAYAATFVFIANHTATSQEGQTSADQRLAMFSTHERMLESSPFQAVNWQFLGPKNISGRVTDIAVAVPGKTFYVAGASGGVWRTDDNGESWRPIFEQGPSTSIGDVTVAPSDPETVWIGTGEANIFRSSMAGCGVFKSSDGGKNFDYVGLAGTHTIPRIVIHPSDPKVVYVAASGHEWTDNKERGVYKTTDGGKTWDQQVALAYLDPDCRDPKLRAQRFENERCDEAYLFAVSVIDADHVVAIGDRSVLTRSSDGGRTWQTETLTFIDPDLSPDWLLAFEDPVLYDVEFVDSRNGYIVGEFGKIYHTTDGGQSWTEQHKSLMDASVFDFMDMPTLFDVEFSDLKNGIAVGLDGRIAITTDGGQDWNFVPNNVEDYEDPFYSAALLPDGTRWVVGASGQAVTAAPADEMGRASLGGSVNSWLRRIRFYDKDTAWIVGGFGLIMNTHDGGKTWYRRMG